MNIIILINASNQSLIFFSLCILVYVKLLFIAVVVLVLSVVLRQLAPLEAVLTEYFHEALGTQVVELAVE